MKKLTTLALAFAFTAFIALADHHKPVEAKIVCGKCTAKIAGAGCSAAVTMKGKDGKEVSYLLSGKLVKGKGCEGIGHGTICKPGSSVAAHVTGKVEGGKFNATKIVAKKK
jgi:hypothetical protein